LDWQLLALLLHTLLRRHTWVCALLCSLLLLLHVRLILEGLLLVGSHVRLLRVVARHAWCHWLGHLGRSIVLLLG
jgi:hypothetical protein